ncbi:MAG: TolC family outer membrane protein [Gammaproteobacteria bacterium]|nr:TolC family outer membrane protein [Gammaproteobacteria bacterium]
MQSMIRPLYLLLLILGISPPLWAFDLLHIYAVAQQNDPVLQSARQAELAAVEAKPQALAGFLPTVGATLNPVNKTTTTATAATGGQTPIPYESYRQTTYGLTLTQPLFYYQQWVQFHQASQQVKAAHATYAAAEQDLMVRTVKGYFNVLSAVDALTFARVQRQALDKYLDQTQQRYKVGLIAITDVQIAKAKRDSAYAQEIAASNGVQDAKEQLRQITGQPVETLRSLRKNIQLAPPKPQIPEDWVQSAFTHNFQLQALRYQTEATRTKINLSQAAHLPALNVSSRLERASSTPFTPRNTSRVVGLQVTMPLFSGGLVRSQTRQAVHVYEQAQKDLETQYKTIERQSRQHYAGVLTQISQAKALKQAIVSNKSALDATEASFNVGTRTIVDVLEAHTNLIAAEQSYASSRYNYFLQSVQLKQAAGSLTPHDLREINDLLENPKT